SSRRRHTRSKRDWSSDVCSSDLGAFVIIFAAAFGVYAMQTLRTEEGSGRADTVLATPVGRISWSLSHVLVIAIGIVLIAAVTGLGTGLAAAVVTEDAALVGDILLSHLAVVPAALAGLGLCTAVFGWLPRLMAPAGWVLVAVMGIVDMFAELLDLPDWFRALSPLHHLAGIPVEDFALTPFLVVTGVAVALVAVGLLGLRRRQVNVV